MVLSLVRRVIVCSVQNCEIFGERKGSALQEGKMLNFRPVELKGLSVLLKGFVLVSALHGGKGTGLTIQAPR